MKNVKRATVNITDDTGTSQVATVETHSTDKKDGIEHHQPYGLAANVGSGDGLLVTVGGTRFLIGVNKPGARPTGLAAGEVKVWSEFGQFMHLKADGNIEVKAPETIVVGNLSVNGEITNNGQSVTHHNHGGIEPGNANTDPMQ